MSFPQFQHLLSYGAKPVLLFDGSSRFAKGNKWGFFPSVSLGWNIANEPFWENLKETVSMFKFRLSYGALGNQNIGLYRYIPTLSYNNHALNYPFDGRETSMGYAITAFPSSDIKWETTVYKNIGVDNPAILNLHLRVMGFLNRRRGCQAASYQRKAEFAAAVTHLASLGVKVQETAFWVCKKGA